MRTFLRALSPLLLVAISLTGFAQESGGRTGTPYRPALANQPGQPAQAGQAAPAAGQTGFIEQGTPAAQQPLTRVTQNLDQLPNTAGQVWREYDISPYTSRVREVEKPQQAILDWILAETGTELWFNQPLGILSAERNRLLVYHTPEIQQVVQTTVDRFVKTQGQMQSVDVNLVTIANPNWRATAYQLLQPIEVRTAGVEAWLISKENAAVLLGQLRQRGDFRQHSSGRLTAPDGQPVEISNTKPVQFVQSIQWMPNQPPYYQPKMTQIDEGYRLNFSSLSSLDNRTMEVMIECEVDQVEKLQPVSVPIAGTTPVLLQVPQLVSWRLHERFRWPADQVLLLSCGVVATPDPQVNRGLPRFLGNSRSRADALMFIEYRGPAAGAERPAVANREGMVPLRRNQ